MAAALKRNPSAEGLRVVALGGGTGLSTLLRGLKRHVQHICANGEAPARGPVISDLAAIVTVSDDGGSSGRLRRDFNMLPPGDIRNCMVALSEDEHLLSRLFQYRFESGEGLEGHSFGNLFLAALAEVTGDFAQAVQTSSQILAARGRIYPATNANVTLRALMDDGEIVSGETSITASDRRIVKLTLEPEFAEPLPETLEAIRHADLITIGPGSLYTSLIPNVLVHGIPEALAESRAVRVYICNLMTQRNESLGLTASDHIARIYEHAGREIFDFALLNTGRISADVLQRYAAEQAHPIEADAAQVEELGVAAICGRFAHEGAVLRHDYDRVAGVLLTLNGRSAKKFEAKQR
jgi:uncharacterized cofD-like protein